MIVQITDLLAYCHSLTVCSKNLYLVDSMALLTNSTFSILTTAMSIYDILESKLSNRNLGKLTCATYIDLSKAFDTVDRKILLNKLEDYGMRWLPLQLFQSYLSNRKQYTLMNGALSSLLDIELGVPQGSTLGPIIF